LEDTVALLLMAARQDRSTLSQVAGPKNYRSKRWVRRQLVFLQGLPGVGPLLAARLLKRSGTLKAAINATEEQLKQVEGIGK
jgi:Fanconi anemia group M protein